MASSATVSAPKKRKSFSEYFHSMRGQQLIVTLVFLFVPLVLLFMFTYLPFFKMVEFSFFKMKYIGRRTFVGLQNYISVFTRKDCFHALSLSLYYMVGSVVQMALALLFATILSFKCKGSKFFRGALYFPCLICGISVGFIFKFFFTHGFVLDTLLSWVGFNVDKLPFWLRDESINNVVLVACSIWKYIGQNIVMFIGAIASVDPVLYEAAEIDGANAWHRFKDIILPSISTIVVLNLIAIARCVPERPAYLHLFAKPLLITAVMALAARSSYGVLVRCLPERCPPSLSPPWSTAYWRWRWAR